MQLQKILCLSILLVVFVRQGLFAQCGQTTQKPVASTAPTPSASPKIAKRNSKDRVLTVGVLGCVSTPARVRVSSWVMGCFLLDHVEPTYPAETADIEDRLTLAVLVGKDGKVFGARKISGPENLVPAAIEAVRKRRYRPYFINGEPVEVETIVDLPAGKASNCAGVLWGVYPVSSAPPSWLFNTHPVMPVLAVERSTPK